MNLRIPSCVALAGTLLLLQPYRPYVVNGESMNPTLVSGQWLVGDSRPREIGRGDIVVFRHDGETMIKRVALLPGDRLERYRFLKDWKIPVNSLMRDAMVRLHLPRRDFAVPQGEFYVVGDNLAESSDSRVYGTIPLEEVLAVIHHVGPTLDPWSAPDHLTSMTVASL